ncbi:MULTISPECIES: hypothetical protein [unclassified Sphingomonas]|uniref:hypothetical protein n=1 Tax=unclassified Sphingomonas TaxID=196159 RepID=UPI0012E24D03|nr:MULTISPECIES: hypothetical protein [unclassified Sphingomonas]
MQTSNGDRANPVSHARKTDEEVWEAYFFTTPVATEERARPELQIVPRPTI